MVLIFFRNTTKNAQNIHKENSPKLSKETSKKSPNKSFRGRPRNFHKEILYNSSTYTQDKQNKSLIYKTSNLQKISPCKSLKLKSRKLKESYCKPSFKPYETKSSKNPKNDFCEPFKKNLSKSHNNEPSNPVEKNFMKLSRIRQIYPFKYCKPTKNPSSDYVISRPFRTNNKTGDLSESQDDILHLWKSVIRLEPSDTKRNDIKVSILHCCLFILRCIIGISYGKLNINCWASCSD